MRTIKMNNSYIFEKIKEFFESETINTQFQYEEFTSNHNLLENIRIIQDKYYELNKVIVEKLKQKNMMDNEKNKEKFKNKDEHKILDYERNQSSTINKDNRIEELQKILESVEKLMFFIQCNLILNKYKNNRIINNFYIDTYIELNEMSPVSRIENEEILSYSIDKKLKKIE